NIIASIIHLVLTQRRARGSALVKLGNRYGSFGALIQCLVALRVGHCCISGVGIAVKTPSRSLAVDCDGTAGDGPERLPSGIANCPGVIDHSTGWKVDFIQFSVIGIIVKLIALV